MKCKTASIMDIERRLFLKKTAGMIGFALSGFGTAGCARRLSTPAERGKIYSDSPAKTSVSIATGTDRRRMIFEAVTPFTNLLQEQIGDRQVLIKINCNGIADQLIKTHPDAVRGVLDCLRTFYDRQILIGESTGFRVPTHEVFNHYGYYSLEKEYNVKMVELNDSNDWPVTFFWILDKDLQPDRIRVLTLFLDPAFYVISVAPMKTHGNVVVTLSLKNVVMGAPQRRQKEGSDMSKMHGSHSRIGNPSVAESPKLINLNMFLLAQKVRPDFSVLDGFIGAEGEGPNNCEPVDHKVAVAGPDFLAVDSIGCGLMGVPWEKVGYLRWLSDICFGQADRDKISILGPDPEKHVISYKLPKNIQWCYEWEKPIDWGLIHTQ